MLNQSLSSVCVLGRRKRTQKPLISRDIKFYGVEPVVKNSTVCLAMCVRGEREGGGGNDDSLPSIPPDGDEMRTAAFSISRFLPSANDSAAVVDVDFPVI